MRVLASPCELPANHYIGSLYNGLNNLGVEICPLTRSETLRGVDLCHIHWPDHILKGNSILHSFHHAFRFFSILAWCKLRWRSKVVWTVHNLEPHERTLPYWWRLLFYKLWFYFVDGCIYMSKASHQAFKVKYRKSFPYAIVPHGHYCDVYKNIIAEKGLREQFKICDGDVVFGHYGQIRDYKNVPYLMREFSKLKSTHYKLIVAGMVHEQDSTLLVDIKNLAIADERIHFIPGFISDSTIKGLYEITHWAVLPYKRILNSGSALLALSLGCPVIVPDLPTMSELRSLVGSRAVRLISNAELSNELSECNLQLYEGCERIYLKGLEWSALSSATYEFYTKICKSV